MKMEAAWSSKILVSYHIIIVLQPEDGGMVLQITGILPHHYIVPQPEDGGSKVLQNVGILPHHIILSQP